MSDLSMCEDVVYGIQTPVDVMENDTVWRILERMRINNFIVTGKMNFKTTDYLAKITKFGDIAWDELCMSDDHTVPHPVEQTNDCSLWSDNYRRPCDGVVGVQGKAKDKSSSRNSFSGKEPEKLASVNNRRKRMLEKDPVRQIPEAVFSSRNRDSGKEDINLAPDANRGFSDCFKSNDMDFTGSDFLAADAFPVDEAAAVESNSYSYPLSQSKNNSAFFDETQDIKDSGDFLYYGWPDIGNLDEVDRMFSNEDEFGWFASSEAVEASTDGSKSEFKSQDSSQVKYNTKNCEHLRNEKQLSLSDMKDAPLSSEDSSWIQEKANNGSVDHFSFVNGVCSSDTEADYMSTERGEELSYEVQRKISDTDHSKNGNSQMMDMHILDPKHGAQSQGENKDLENRGYRKSLHDEIAENVSKRATSDVLSCMGIKQEKQPLNCESLGCLPCNIQCINSDYCSPSDLSSEYGTLSAVKCDNNGFTSVSLKEPYSSIQMLSTESSHGIQYQAAAVPNEKVPLCNPVSAQEKVQHRADTFDILNEAEDVPTELGFSSLQECSSVSSTLDDISLEAASFRQLQLVMEQLDLRTKLCIRDSLYRLARSAAQRHNHADADLGCSQNDQGASRVMMTQGANECTGFMDMETDTNPIDRSIAHLLFHRPSAPTAIPTQESSLNNTAAPIHDHMLRPQVVSEKWIADEMGAAEAEGEVTEA